MIEPWRGRKLIARITMLSILGLIVGLAFVFRIVGFHSITEFEIENRLSHSLCSITWDQERRVCSDAVADVVDLPIMRVFATRVSAADWQDLALHDIALVPKHCTTLAVRHTLQAYGIMTEPGLMTQMVWLSDGGVYAVAGHGFARGDAATLCIGSAGNDRRERLALQLANGEHTRYIAVFPMPRATQG